MFAANFEFSDSGSDDESFNYCLVKKKIRAESGLLELNNKR